MTEANARFVSWSTANHHETLIKWKFILQLERHSAIYWATYGMCSHMLAAAETAGSLKQSLHWFKGRKRSPSHLAVANLNMPRNSGQKVGTKKRKGASNKPPSEGRLVMCSRVLQPSNGTLPNVPTNHEPPGHTPSMQCYSTYPQVQPSLGLGVSENPPIIYNSPCVQTTIHIPPYVTVQSPRHPKPPPGIFAFAKLSFLDSKVSRFYGCGESMKPGGLIPHPPDELVLTTRLHQKYYKDGSQHTCPDLSLVYCHLNTYCPTTAFPTFNPSL